MSELLPLANKGAREHSNHLLGDSNSSAALTLPEEPHKLEKAFRQISQKRGNSDGKTRELGIVFKNLHVVGLGACVSYQPTIGSVLNPLTMVESFQRFRHPPTRDILSAFEGVVQPGEMILVLGCSTFLKTLGNRRKEYHSVEGEVHYDSISPSDLQTHLRGDVQYCPEDDTHFPTLTVEKTLKFAATTRTPRDRSYKSRDSYAEKVTDTLMTIFGLQHARKTVIGDQMMPGVSGGEKKSVSIAEALAARSCIGAWDNSTRGLDSSTALEFVQALRIATDTSRLTTIVLIHQAGEPLYRHFDKVCVINEEKWPILVPLIEPGNTSLIWDMFRNLHATKPIFRHEA